MHSEVELRALKRKDLQKIAKKNGIRANQTSKAIIAMLLEKFQKKNKKNEYSCKKCAGCNGPPCRYYPEWYDHDAIIWDSEGDESGHADW